MPYYRLMGQIFVAVETWDGEPDVREAMSKEGLTNDDVQKGRELVETGEKLVEKRRRDAGGDRMVFHSVHEAANEVDMWAQSVKVNLRSKVDDQQVIDRAVNHGFHAHDHTVTIIAGAFRTLGVLRTDTRVEEAHDRRQSLRDLIVRGATLLDKLFDNTVSLVGEITTSRRSDVFSKLRDHQETMDDWVVELSRVAEQLREKPQLLGLTGYLPEGVGLPAGGTSFAVPRHKRAQHREAPRGDEPGSTSGWSVGRQGRNRENLGEGFVEPNFD